MKKDRFLLVMLILLGLLVAAAVAAFILRRDQTQYGAEDTPAGVLRNYILAVQKRDLDRAYGYLADTPARPSRSDFDDLMNYSDFRPVRLGETSAGTGENEALIPFTEIYSNAYQDITREGYDGRAVLVKQGGQWKIKSLPYSSYWQGWWDKDY